MSRRNLDPRREDGFSLTELLVGMVCSVIVLAGLATVLQVAYDQATHVSDVTTADQTGRTAMAAVVEPLHSSCTGFGNYLAIQAPEEAVTAPLTKLSSTSLWFITTYGSKTSGEAVPTEGYLHNVVWKQEEEGGKKIEVAGKKLGELVDYSFKGTFNGEKGKWTFPELKTANATKKTLATNVVPSTPLVAELFRYYQYEKTGSESVLKQLKTEAEMQAAAKEKTTGISKVAINFTQAPSRADASREGSLAEMSNTVVFRFNAIESGTEDTNDTCK